jgi:CubicO group peptidase (beta-lactamase class C family)
MRAVLEQGLSEHAFPGAIAVVGTRDGVLAQASVGFLDKTSGVKPGPNTLWDLASLTKVVGTTTAVMQLVEAGKVDLDSSVSRYLPRFDGYGKSSVTVRQLLTHASGLPPSAPLQFEPEAKAALDLVYSTALTGTPGQSMVYSDLNAILLGELIRVVSGKPLDAYLKERVFEPLGMTSTRFRPTPPQRRRAAPTECDWAQQQWLEGVVHDEKARKLGGVAGHAGLFSSAPDMIRFAQMLLHEGQGPKGKVLDPASIRAFTQPANPDVSHRSLGWETARGAGSSGTRLSVHAFGHTGFTGTSLWVDPDQGLFVLLLSNRVHPTRENSKIGPVRTQLADAAVKALGLTRANSPH